MQERPKGSGCVRSVWPARGVHGFGPETERSVSKPAWCLALLLRLGAVLLLTGLPQLTLAVEDGIGPKADQEVRQVRRLLFFERATSTRVASGAAPAFHESGVPVPVAWRQDPSGTRLAARHVVRGTGAVVRSVPLGPPEWMAVILRVIARHQSSYV